MSNENEKTANQTKKRKGTSVKRLPTKINISGFDFKIKEVDLLDKHGFCGLASHEAKWIKIDNSCSKSDAESTLLHEILHMIIRLNLGHEFLGPEKEELLITCLETHLHKLYRLRQPKKSHRTQDDN